jgi:putative phosphoserine phosphatase/1-acylglycerol-3-phosphate O-acyltransferase
VLRRGDQTIRPGEVQVIVLAPIDTDDWRAETIDDHVREVRDAYQRTLASWPGAPSRPRLPARSR